MNKLPFIIITILFIVSCRNQPSQAVNQYTTPPEIGILTTDLPQIGKPPVSVTQESRTPHIPKQYTPVNKDSIYSLSTSDSLAHENHSGIYTVNTAAFSWEIGIRLTQILDVRSIEEYQTGHIYDAININVDSPTFIHQIQSLDKHRPVAVYCRSGIRSMHAAKILLENGFETIYNLEGGLNQWKNDGKEIFQ